MLDRISFSKTLKSSSKIFRSRGFGRCACTKKRSGRNPASCAAFTCVPAPRGDSGIGPVTPRACRQGFPIAEEARGRSAPEEHLVIAKIDEALREARDCPERELYGLGVEGRPRELEAAEDDAMRHESDVRPAGSLDVDVIWVLIIRNHPDMTYPGCVIDDRAEAVAQLLVLEIPACRKIPAGTCDRRPADRFGRSPRSVPGAPGKTDPGRQPRLSPHRFRRWRSWRGSFSALKVVERQIDVRIDVDVHATPDLQWHHQLRIIILRLRLETGYARAACQRAAISAVAASRIFRAARGFGHFYGCSAHRQHPCKRDQLSQAAARLRIPSALRYRRLRPSPVLELALPNALDPLGRLGAGGLAAVKPAPTVFHGRPSTRAARPVPGSAPLHRSQVKRRVAVQQASETVTHGLSRSISPSPPSLLPAPATPGTLCATTACPPSATLTYWCTTLTCCLPPRRS